MQMDSFLKVLGFILLVIALKIVFPGVFHAIEQALLIPFNPNTLQATVLPSISN